MIDTNNVNTISTILKLNLTKNIKSPINKLRNIKFSRNEAHNSIDAYIGYDGNPLKSYEKLKISVLDTHYNPFCNFRYREDKSTCQTR